MVPQIQEVFKGNGVEKEISEELASLNQWFEDHFECREGFPAPYFEESVPEGLYRHIYTTFALGVGAVDTPSQVALIRAMKESFEGLLKLDPTLEGQRLWFRKRFEVTEDFGKTKIYGRLCIDDVATFPEIYRKDEGQPPREISELTRKRFII